MSSGVVSERTRITSSWALPRASASSASKTIFPRAAPGEALRPFAATSKCAVGVDHRVQELVELGGVDPGDRVLARDQALLDHRDGALHGGCRRPLRGARLQHEEALVLDRELDVLHVAVVLLEAAHRLHELLEGLRELRLHPLERLGGADPGDDVLALGVHQELAVETRLAGGRVARERDAGARALALVAEDHLLHVDGGADVVRDPVRAPVDLGARGVPRVEDRAYGAGELAARVLREPTLLLRVDPLVARDQLGEILGGEVGVARDVAPRLEVGELLLEAVVLDPVDHLAVHLDQAPVRVGGEARVARALGDPLARPRR